MTKKQRILFRILLLLYLAAVSYLCFTSIGVPSSMKWTLWGFQSDKVMHAVMFMPFPLLAFLSLPGQGRRFWHCLLIAAGLILLGMGVAGATEIVQGWIPTRCADMQDFQADVLGLLIGALAIPVCSLYLLSVRRND